MKGTQELWVEPSKCEEDDNTSGFDTDIEFEQSDDDVHIVCSNKI